MSNSRPFPRVAGGCACHTIRYVMETAPMFVSACHCYECQKQTGSAFGVYATIEADRVKVTTDDVPHQVTIARVGGNKSSVRSFICQKCMTILWETSGHPGAIGVKVGTLDMPSIMDPDLHMFIETKVPWILLADDAKTCKGPSKGTDAWPKSSLLRLQACRAKALAAQAQAQEADKAKAQDVEDTPQDEADAQADKTPTAVSPEENDDFEDQDQDADEELERRQKVLEERLAMLTLKISEQEK